MVVSIYANSPYLCLLHNELISCYGCLARIYLSASMQAGWEKSMLGRRYHTHCLSPPRDISEKCCNMSIAHKSKVYFQGGRLNW